MIKHQRSVPKPHTSSQADAKFFFFEKASAGLWNSFTQPFHRARVGCWLLIGMSPAMNAVRALPTLQVE